MTIERPFFPPRVSSRRHFIAIAAGASVASIRSTAQASPIESAAMVEARAKLEATFAIAAEAARANDAANDAFAAWIDKNPEPASKKAKRRWRKLVVAESNRLCTKPWSELIAVEKDFTEAAAALAAVPIFSS